MRPKAPIPRRRARRGCRWASWCAARPGRTRWAKWVCRPVALLPGAPPADWRLLREEDGVTDFHAATLPLELHRRDVEAYKVSLSP